VQNWWENNEALTYEYERELDGAIYEAIQAHNDKWTRKLEDDVNNNLIPQILARTTARQTVTE
jgi:CRISPR/Cas system endoribonuclease Cas6 (RAMP superfamily)